MLTSFSYIYNLAFICLLRPTNRTEDRRKLENLITSHTLEHLEVEEKHLSIPFTAFTGFFSKTCFQLLSYIIKPVLCHSVLVTAQSTRLQFHLRSKNWLTRNCVWCSPSSSPMLLSKSPYSKSDSTTCQAQGSRMSGRDRRCTTKQFCFSISILYDVSITPTNINNTIKPNVQLEHKCDLASNTPKICSRKKMPV